ncbi:MAG: mismatch repair protein MutT [Alphaproteobacteria bacterium]|jgi:8-oxo-dGTP pyrophosphatase MutT (NUDIX family)|nr:mismatch repair protein MutT [Alphaproteobacteria bacterium]
MNKNDIHVLSRAVIIIDGHILLAYDPRSTPNHYYELNASFYYLPGGHIEFKESARDATLREIQEETGYTACYERFLGVIEHAWNFSGDEVYCHTHEINLIFKVHIQGLNPTITISQKEDHVAFRWIPLTEINTIDLRPAPLKSLLPRWMDMNVAPELVSTFP